MECRALWVVILMIGALGAGARGAETKEEGSGMLVYFGTSTGGSSGSRGIYVSRFDAEKGTLSEPKVAAETIRPSFLAGHPKLDVLYACSEVNDMDGKKMGGVCAFSVDAKSGALTKLGETVPSGGMGPCYVSVDHSGRAVLVANYTGGSVAAIALDPSTGSLTSVRSVVQHHGSGPNPKRQDKPYAHSINPDPTNQFAVACDLGTDQVIVYKFDPAPPDPREKMLTEHSVAKVAPGSGPRHLAWGRDQKFAYVSNEMLSTVTAFAWDAARGTLSEVQTISTLPADYAGAKDNTSAEVAVSPNGRFVYASNRGHDSIAIFAVDPASGKLDPRGHAPTGGNVPRHFAMEPVGGKFMLVGNQNSGTVVVMRVDEQSGALTATEVSVKVPAVTCVRFWR